MHEERIKSYSTFFEEIFLLACKCGQLPVNLEFLTSSKETLLLWFNFKKYFHKHQDKVRFEFQNKDVFINQDLKFSTLF